jgi:hypothetical protein
VAPQDEVFLNIITDYFILRCLAQRGLEGRTMLMPIKLRVREADKLLEGIPQGQKLGALLGYRFERGLHDLGFDAVIPRMRTLAPLDVPVLDNSTTPMEAIAANNVVDGQLLAQMWQDSPGHVQDHMQPSDPGVPPLTPDQLATIGHELDALIDAIDGLTDALTAEAAYQMAREYLAPREHPDSHCKRRRTAAGARGGSDAAQRYRVDSSGSCAVQRCACGQSRLAGDQRINTRQQRANAQCLGLKAAGRRHEGALHDPASRKQWRGC